MSVAHAPAAVEVNRASAARSALWSVVENGGLALILGKQRLHGEHLERIIELVTPEKKEGEMGERKAGMLPYVTLAAGAAVVLLANWFFQLPAA